jgi:hypothetical protein
MQLAEDTTQYRAARIAQLANQIIRSIAAFKLTVNQARRPGSAEAVQFSDEIDPKG